MGTAILAATTQAAYVQKNHTLIWAYIPIKFPFFCFYSYIIILEYIYGNNLNTDRFLYSSFFH